MFATQIDRPRVLEAQRTKNPDHRTGATDQASFGELDYISGHVATSRNVGHNVVCFICRVYVPNIYM